MIKTAIIGVGNCACSLIQARDLARQGEEVSGIAYPFVGGYGVSDIEFVAAYDIDRRKVGRPLSEAIFCTPNCTTKYLDVSHSDVIVSRGAVLDGVGQHMTDSFQVDPASLDKSMEEIVTELKKVGTNVVISYLPVGSDSAAKFYATCALEAGCAFVNCMPTHLANDKEIAERFRINGLPILGDDIKSQIGSTSIHRTLISLLHAKGVSIDSTYQLNIGGNTDFKNMRDPERAASKKFTKEASLNTVCETDIPALGVGPSDYVPHLKDRKVGYIHIAGKALLGMNYQIELKLEVEDSPNSAGVAINAIRAAMTGLDRKLCGPISEASSALFKFPITQWHEDIAIAKFEEFAKKL